MTLAVGTIANPYKRLDGVETVKVAFRSSIETAAALKALTAQLEMEGIARNEWLEALVRQGIKEDFRPTGQRQKLDQEIAVLEARLKELRAERDAL